MSSLGLLLTLLGFTAPTDTLVRTAAEFHEAVRQAQPGDTIVMADGEWKDVVLVFDADGLEGDSITVRAESPGRVILTGTSRLRIGGRYLKVDGLWFHRGALDSGHVVQFRTNRHAHHSRLTNCAVTEYNPANWLVQYKWVSLYGTHNRVDHCYLAGKTHDGATLVVWLEDPPDDRPNYHRIDHNHFGWRPVLGKNGGETIRIGTSARSMQDSHTLVEFNLFHRTDGEHEIISNKTGRNTFRYNTFLEAQGALTLRHGNHAVITQNYFLGGNRPGTGGVRVIGEGHEVSHNYFANLQGDSSRAALSIMNGIPNSPLNRYFQVKRPLITRNTFIDTHKTILYGLGADEEKTLLPEDVRFSGNVVVTTSEQSVVTAQVSMDDVSWDGNVFHGTGLGVSIQPGIEWAKSNLTIGLGNLSHPSTMDTGARMAYPPLTQTDVGPSWWGQPWTPTILSDTANGLPDFSYAGYHWGERPLPDHPVTFNVTDFGATGQDMNDDTRAFQAALDEAHAHSGPVTLGIPAGVYHFSGVLLLQRDSLVLRGSGLGVTKIYIEKPLGALDMPPGFTRPTDTELVRGRAVSPFTQAGGIIWSRISDESKDEPSTAILGFSKGGHAIRIENPELIATSGEARIVWGREDMLQVSIIGKEDNVIYTKAPLPIDFADTPEARLIPLKRLTEIGIEHLTVEFEPVPYGGHQLEDGYNAIYLTQVRHGWVRDVEIVNSDAGIIVEDAAHVTLKDIRIRGRKSHIGIDLIDAWQNLARDVQVDSDAIHPIGIIGASGYNVLHECKSDHLFDISSSHPNLFDHLVMEPSDAGRDLWTTDDPTRIVLWHTDIRYVRNTTLRLPAYTGELGSEAVVVGLSSSVPIRFQTHYGTHLEGINRSGISAPSLYDIQLRRRLGGKDLN